VYAKHLRRLNYVDYKHHHNPYTINIAGKEDREFFSALLLA